MQGRQQDRPQALLSIRSEYALLTGLVDYARDLGFDYCAYGLRVPFPVTRPETVMLNNYPAAWQAWYREKHYLAIDPTVRHGMHSPLPIIWPDDLLISAPELWEDARSFGLCFGWAQSIRDANGLCGMLTLARSREPLTDSELRHKGFEMAWLAQAAHLGMAQCLSEKLLPETAVDLTERELVVLRWTADGKTAGEISDILGITERTVNYHSRNAMAKLGTTNKLAAAVRAAMLGLLY